MRHIDLGSEEFGKEKKIEVCKHIEILGVDYPPQAGEYQRELNIL